MYRTANRAAPQTNEETPGQIKEGSPSSQG
jgi:hypothetical protein